MRDKTPERLEKARIRQGPYGSTAELGLTGAFKILSPCATWLHIISSGSDLDITQDWEHVSVSTRSRVPNWKEMCFVKDLFWGDNETVVQFHPSKNNYINFHPFCLHLWKSIKEPFPMPPIELVGPRKVEVQK